MDREGLIKILEEDEYAYHVYPHHGCVLDWYKAYWRLHMAVREYLEVDKEDNSK